SVIAGEGARQRGGGADVAARASAVERVERATAGDAGAGRGGGVERDADRAALSRIRDEDRGGRVRSTGAVVDRSHPVQRTLDAARVRPAVHAAVGTAVRGPSIRQRSAAAVRREQIRAAVRVRTGASAERDERESGGEVSHQGPIWAARGPLKGRRGSPRRGSSR